MPLRTKFHRRETTNPTTGQVVNSPVLASAALVSQQELRAASRREDWQKQAWGFYDTTPELRFGAEWLSSALSRSRLYITEADRVGTDSTITPEPVEDQRINAPLAELFGGRGGQSQMLSRMAIHLTIPGETYMIGMDWDGERRWLTASNDEFTSTRGRTQVRLPETDRMVELDPQSAVIIRMWRPHPRRANYANSPTRGLLGPLAELQGLSNHISATVDSRLAGAGVLVLPESASMPRPEQSDGVNPVHDDPWTAALIEAMVTPITNRDSAAAVVPIVTKVPDEAAGKVQHLSFATELDGQVTDMRNNAIRRVALGIDVPPEILLGVGDTNHWSAWQVTESAIQMHVRPLLALICDALTEQYLRPALQALNVPNPDRYTVWLDTSELQQRPDRGPETLELYDRGLVSDDTVRTEHGFGDEAAPTEEEHRRHLAIRLLLSSPGLAPYLLPLLDLGTGAPQPPPPAGGEDETGGRELQPGNETGRPELPEGEPSPPGQQASAALAALGNNWQLACLEIAVYRALERAGQWLLNSGPRSHRGEYKHVPLHSIHCHMQVPTGRIDHILSGAYSELATVLPESDCLHRTVDEYVRALLLAGEQHQKHYLRMAVARSGCGDQYAA